MLIPDYRSAFNITNRFLVFYVQSYKNNLIPKYQYINIQIYQGMKI